MIHQPREHSVPCQWCRRPTWNYNAVCDVCKEKHQDGNTVSDEGSLEKAASSA